jgi:hypothetical protein
MSNQMSTASAHIGSTTTHRAHDAKRVSPLRWRRIQMLVLTATIAASMVACDNGATKPTSPAPIRVAQTGSSVTPAKPTSPPTPKPTDSRPNHPTLTGPRAYS